MSTKEKNMDARIAFGNSLSEKRRESGFSQEELGLKIGKSSNAVSRYENAENTMDVHTFAKTVNALKASPYELLKDLEVPEPDSKIVSLFFQIQRLDKGSINPKHKEGNCDQRSVLSVFGLWVWKLSDV